MAEVKLRRTDMRKNEIQPVHQAVCLLHKRMVEGCAKDGKKPGSKAARHGEMARSLRASLDNSLGPQWHVLIGNSVGFACKKRNNTMAVWGIGDSTLVIWKSPGIEPISEPSESEKQAEVSASTASSSEAPCDSASASADPKSSGAAIAASLKVLEPSSVEPGSEVETTVAAVRDELRMMSAETCADVQETAQALRRRLTRELGTIWHIAVGNDFVIEPAPDRRNFVLAMAGKFRLVAFQHEQRTEGGFLSTIDWGKLTKALPYLLLLLMCLGYMTMNAVCDKEPEGAWGLWLRPHICGESRENGIHMLGMLALGTLVISRGMSFIMKRKNV